MISKILGGLSIIGGLIFILVFPDITEFQSRPFSRTGIIIGGILILLGIYLIKS